MTKNRLATLGFVSAFFVVTLVTATIGWVQPYRCHDQP
jgi:hypothetical protein